MICVDVGIGIERQLHAEDTFDHGIFSTAKGREQEAGEDDANCLILLG